MLLSHNGVDMKGLSMLETAVFSSQAQGGKEGWDYFITEECCSLRENQTTLQFCFIYSRRGVKKKQFSHILVQQIPQGRSIFELLPRTREGEKEGKEARKQNSILPLGF